MTIIILIIASDNTTEYIEMQNIWRKNIMNNNHENIRIVIIGASTKPIRMTGIELRVTNSEKDITIKDIADELKERIDFIDDIFNSAAGKIHITTELLLEGLKHLKNMH